MRSILLVTFLALSACATVSPTERARRERARGIALAYLARHHIRLPAEAKVDVGVGTFKAEINPLRHFYGVSVSLPFEPHRKRTYEVILDPHDPRRELIYDIWVDPRDWSVELFTDMRRLTPAG